MRGAKRHLAWMVSEDYFIDVVVSSRSMIEIMNRLDIQNYHAGRRAIISRCGELGIDYPRYGREDFKVRKVRTKPLPKLEEFLASGRSPGVVRRRILKEKAIPYICFKCGMGPRWLDEELILQLDHIDGNKKNNDLRNLRFLCPNCHSQTPTWCYRNGKREYR